MKATIENFITIFTPLTDKLVAIINADLKEDNRSPLTNKDIEYIKILSVSKFLNMSERYILPTDNIVETDFSLSTNGKVEGHISFERDGQNYFLNTQCIVASGVVQRPHYRYILGATNAPKLYENPITERVNVMNKLSKYKYETEDTKEGKKIVDLERSIKFINQETVNKNINTDFQWWKNNINKVYFTTNLDGIYEIGGWSNYHLMQHLMGFNPSEIEAKWDGMIENKTFYDGINSDIKAYVNKFYTSNIPTKKIEALRKRFVVSQAKKVAKIEAQIEELKTTIAHKRIEFDKTIKGDFDI